MTQHHWYPCMGPIHFLMYVYMSLLFSGLFSSNKERKSRTKKEEEALAPTKHKIQFSMVCCSGTMEHHVHPNRLSRHMHKTNHAGLGHLLFISTIGRGGSFFEKEIFKLFENVTWLSFANSILFRNWNIWIDRY